MPTNLYGPGDNFDLKNSHVLAALIRKIFEAHQNGQKEITLWGSGKPRREFLHVDDFAEAVIFCLDYYHDAMPINIGVGKDVSIEELSNLISREVGFEGKIKWDTSIPDGINQKRLDVSKISNLGWHSKIELDSGINETVKWFIRNQNSARLDVQISLIS
jgi:GDP-L-fucose synthase